MAQSDLGSTRITLEVMKENPGDVGTYSQREEARCEGHGKDGTHTEGLWKGGNLSYIQNMIFRGNQQLV